MNTVEKLIDKIFPEPNSGCWLFTGSLDNDGYGRFKHKASGSWGAHRAAYSILIGPIPPGLQIDHLCRNKACINPVHLEAVEEITNIRRSNNMGARNAKKTHCPKGHEYSEKNTYAWRNSRICRQCSRERQRKSVA